MDWSEDGYILSVRSHGETSAIVNAFTKERGHHAGLVRGGRSRRARPVLQAGNKVNLNWRARLSDHLGNFTIEPLDARAATIMEDRLSLAALNSMSAIIIGVLPEREPHPNLFKVYEILLENLHNIDIWPALYIRFEMAVLQALGYGLDLSECAATGTANNLTYISPRSGRAVCADAAQPCLDKLLPLPNFLQDSGVVKDGDLAKGLDMTAYFLRSRVFHLFHKDLPKARTMLVSRLSQVGLI